MAPAVDTVIFVDIDGVLNVGIRDHDNAPLLLNDSNVRMSLRCKDLSTFGPAEQECIMKMSFVAQRSLGEDKMAGTYADLACGTKQPCSALLIQRLVAIIRAAEGRQSVILSSNWRRTKYASRVRSLEEQVSKCLGSEFKFDGKTELKEEFTAGDRLRCIGNYVRRIYANRGQDIEGDGAREPLRVLILDDFFVNPLNGWDCGDARVYSTADAEAYVRGCAPSSASTSGALEVKLVHCYEEWRTQGGLLVQVGAGLSAQDVRTAQKFLRDGAHAQQPAEDISPAAEAASPARAGAEQLAKSASVRRVTEVAATLGVCWAGCLGLAFPWLCLHL